jgi:hypothetical protein
MVGMGSAKEDEQLLPISATLDAVLVEGPQASVKAEGGPVGETGSWDEWTNEAKDDLTASSQVSREQKTEMKIENMFSMMEPPVTAPSPSASPTKTRVCTAYPSTRLHLFSLAPQGLAFGTKQCLCHCCSLVQVTRQWFERDPLQLSPVQ